jgi:hypothetical protein
MRLSSALCRATRLAFAACGLAAALAGCGGDELAVAPQRIALSASPNGIAVRASDGAVFITDDQTSSVLSTPVLSRTTPACRRWPASRTA